MKLHHQEQLAMSQRLASIAHAINEAATDLANGLADDTRVLHRLRLAADSLTREINIFYRRDKQEPET